jgi:thioredoxin-dependent peroxiredoxin
MATHLKSGDPAPDFSAPATDGRMLRLTDFRGRKLVLYFYPMDDTPGCTKQACSLRDANAEIAARGAAILGVSAQGSESHQRFTEKFSLNFPLLADTDLTVAKAYGVAGSGLGGLLRSVVKVSERVTFIIDEKGLISHVIDDPDCPDHGAEVLAAL